MKKFSFLILSVFLCFSCSNFFEHDVEISNNSSYEVSFQLERYDDTVYTLASGKSITLEIYNNPTLVFQGNPRVAYSSNTSVRIYNLTAYEYNVTNNSSASIVLSEKNGLLGDTYGETVTLTGSETLAITVYAKKPSWQAWYENDHTADALDWLTITRLTN